MRGASSAGGNVFFLKNFRLVFLGTLVSELGAVLYSFAVSFYILEITDNNAFLQGLYLALGSAVLMIFMPIGGVLGDRYHKARIMFICDYVKGGLIILATLGMFFFRDHSAQLAILYLAGILGNAVSGIFSPAAGALLPHIVAEEQLQQANAYYSVKNSIQTIFGVVMAGILYAALPIYALLTIVGICYVLSGVSEMFIRYEHRPPEEKLSIRYVLSDMSSGFRYLKAQKAIMVLMAAILFINFFMNPITGNFIPLFVRTDIAAAPSYLFDRLLTPELWSSVYSMLIGISMLAGSLILSKRPPAEKCGHKTGVKLCGMAAIIICLAFSYWILVDKGRSLDLFLILLSAGAFITGFFIAFINIPVNTTIMRVVDREKLSKVTSIINILSMGLIPVSSVLAGAMLQLWGSTPLLFTCAGGFTAAAIFLLLSREAKNI